MQIEGELLEGRSEVEPTRKKAIQEAGAAALANAMGMPLPQSKASSNKSSPVIEAKNSPIVTPAPLPVMPSELEPEFADFHFQCKCEETQIGDTVCIIGNHPLLGGWSDPVPLDPEMYPLWRSTRIPLDSQVEYKYVIRTGDGDILWEQFEGNRTFQPNTLLPVDEPRFR
eukprot:GHVN01067731.1.p1 GENE.GHVN01067731.1~~GHVN01067731.1.p1  ORF type:complete len:170 (-),score=12.65 GHVN01067731.1:111-620(-)